MKKSYGFCYDKAGNLKDVSAPFTVNTDGTFKEVKKPTKAKKTKK